jgi:hypothetical protein
VLRVAGVAVTYLFPVTVLAEEEGKYNTARTLLALFEAFNSADFSKEKATRSYRISNRKRSTAD